MTSMVGFANIYANQSMSMPTSSRIHYIATWFYKESEKEASFYPQMGRKGSSSLVHSVYMKIQVPFFLTFQRYNPTVRFLFFTNLKLKDLPDYLQQLFQQLNVEVVTLPYISRPPRDWYGSWQNQFYLFDIFRWMQRKMNPMDSLLVCDADCLCRHPLDGLFEDVERDGSALYEFITYPEVRVNGIRLEQMQELYIRVYGEKPAEHIVYYGGEFIALRGDVIKHINETFPTLWHKNLNYREEGLPTLNEEAHVLSILAEHLHIRNRHANRYVKRMWTSPQFTNVEPGDENHPVWHLPYEKKRGLIRLYNTLSKTGGITDEQAFWKRAGRVTGIPTIGWAKRIYDRCVTLFMKFR